MSGFSTLLQGIRHHVEQSPQAIAVEDGAQKLSYRDLDLLSDHHAAALRLEGVKSGESVALTLPRSWQQVVCLLALVKCGAVAVPLDRQSPRARQLEMLSDIGCDRVIALEETGLEKIRTLTPEQLQQVPRHAGFTPVERRADDPAFIFFTSGSTGKPKAVIVPERGILRLAVPGYLPLQSPMRFGHASNPSFDALSFDLWAPLLSGGTCVVIPEEVSEDFARFERHLQEAGVETMFLTVALFNAIAEDRPNCFSALSHLLIGGEQINLPRVQAWYQANPKSHCKIYNVYGPTECTTFALCWPIPRDPALTEAPIGFPLAGTGILIEDSTGARITGTETGELLIGGDAVSLGYHARPDETAAAFVQRDGQRFYRTGDLVQRRPDGAVVFAGRKDRQVKIRGFRVEPGEIEARIATLPAVSQCHVVARNSGSTPNELQAWLVLASAVEFDKFRAELRDLLPAYMVPHHLYRCESFPRTANGKVDVKALQGLGLLPWRSEHLRGQEEPSPLVDLAAELLDRPDACGSDHFLSLGGDSLAALRFKHRAAKDLSRDLRVQDILALPLAELDRRAGRISDTEKQEPDFEQAAIAPASSEQKRIWLHTLKTPESRAYSVPLIFRLEGEINCGRLEAAFRDLIAAHPVFCTGFHDSGEGLQQILKPQSQCRFERRTEAATSQATFQDHCESFFAQRFDLTEPDLCRLCWLPAQHGGGWLLIHAHHIILDGWSLNLMLQELSERYNGKWVEPEAGTSPLPDMTGFARHQAQRHAEEEYRETCKALATYIEGKVDPEPALAPLRSATGLRAKVLRQPLSAKSTAKVQAFAARFGLTPFQVFASICSLAYSRISGQRAFLMATPTSNREDHRFAYTIGMMANTLLLPVDLNSKAGLGETIQQLSQDWKPCLEHPQAALEHVVAELKQDHPARSGHFGCMFVLENTDYAALQLEGARASFELPPVVEAKAPLTATVLQYEGRMELIAEIQDSQFQREDAACFLSTYQTILDRLETPEDAAGELINPDKNVWQGASDAPGRRNFSQALRQSFRRSARKPAVSLGGRAQTFAQLDRQACALAHEIKGALPAQGSGVVGLYLEPSVEHIASLLALAQLGLTILPLDPSYPQAWLKQVVDLAQPDLILTGASSPKVSFTAETLKVDLRDTDRVSWPTRVSDWAPLYLLFTSGSTGTPKGVEIHSDALLNLIDWQARDGGLGEPAETQQFSKLSFDVSFQEILSSLLGGGCLHLLPPELRQDMDALLDHMQENAITRIYLPFVALQQLASAATARGLALGQLRQVVSAGENLLLTEEIRNWFKQMPQARLINHYGPSETHVIASHTLPADVADWPDLAPIGRPIANVRFKIEDGVLWAAGRYIRPCYLDPLLNEAAFKADTTGQLWYRTGDRAELLRNREILCLGRGDTQIKFSGHRIELGHVEALLSAVPGVGIAMLAVSGPNRLVGFIQWEAEPLSLDQINQTLAQRLPIPLRLAELQEVQAWPRTPSGKIDRKALQPAALPKTPEQTPIWQTPEAHSLAVLFQEVLGLPISPGQSFFDAGANSLDLMQFRQACQKAYDCKVPMTLLFEQENIEKLSAALSRRSATSNAQARTARLAPIEAPLPRQEKIAIIGMAAGLPGAPDLVAFRRMITQNTSGIEHFAANENKSGGDKSGGGQVGARSQIQDLLGFDPAYFGLSRKEARLMDPQQRHLLMGAVHALQDAGINPQTSPHCIGVVASIGENTYFQEMLKIGDAAAMPDPFQMALHQDKDFAATKIAYQLGLTGPAINLQTACSSSLAGLHIAASQLRAGDSDVMLVGACLADMSLSQGYRYRPQHIFSKDGNCRPFDAQASGTIGASGWGFVVLKPLSQAIADQDRIHVVLEGSALNNDGQDKMGYSSPSEVGQARVITAALQHAGIAPEEVDYVEAHGTGTQLGDPIEIAALDRAYGKRATPLTVSSLKSQIGHLGAAAGIAGVIRVALSITSQVLPPNLHFETANPELELSKRRISIPPLAQPWPNSNRRLAGVSSFGIGGTNAHVILGEAPAQASPSQPAPQVVLLSAHSVAVLGTWGRQIADYLEANPDQAEASLRFLQSGTPQHKARAGFVWQGIDDALTRLRQLTSPELINQQSSWNAEGREPEEILSHWRAGHILDFGTASAPAPQGFPLYPFAKEVFSFASGSAKPLATVEHAPNRLPEQEWLSQPVWLPAGRLQSPPQRPLGILIYDAATPLSLIAAAESAYGQVIRIERESRCRDTGAAPTHSFAAQLSAATEALPKETDADLVNLMPSGLPKGLSPDAVEGAQFACLDCIPDLAALAQRMGRNSRLLHISNGGAAAFGPLEQPWTGLLCGASLVVPQECAIASYWIDTSGAGQDLTLALRQTDLPGHRLALSGGRLWCLGHAPALAPVAKPEPALGPRLWVVIGGGGGLGRNISLQLLQDPQTHVAIYSRSGQIPPQLAPFSDRITAHVCDLTGPDPIQFDFDTPLHGVVFAAGSASGCLLQNRTPETMRQSNAVKIEGLLACERLIEQAQPNEVIYCSSMAAWFGGTGQLDYAATNGLLDAAAHWCNPKAPEVRRMSINWDIWNESGMAVDALQGDARHQAHLKLGLSDAEGQRVFSRCLEAMPPQILVTTVAHREAMQFYSAKGSAPPQENTAENTAPGLSPLPSAQAIAALLAALLDCQEIPLDASLEELGCDSLGQLDLIDRISATFGTTLSLSELTASTTCQEIATLLAGPVAKDPVQSLIDSIKELTGSPDIHADQTLDMLGLDSLMALDLLEEIKHKFDRDLPLSALHQSASVGSILSLLDTGFERPKVQVETWQMGKGHQALCLIHPVGGETVAYRTLASLVPEDVTVVAISDPNLGPTPHPQSIAEKASAYLHALWQALPSGSNITLAGWSFGAWVAQDMAVQAAEAGQPMEGLTLIDPPDPAVGKKMGSYSRGEIEEALLYELAPRLRGSDGKGALATQVAPELQSHLDKIVTCCDLNIKSMRGHVPKRLGTTPVKLYLARDKAAGLLVDPPAPQEQLGNWRGILQKLTEARILPADHYSILAGENCAAIAASLFTHIGQWEETI